jgi:hypothetical protein
LLKKIEFREMGIYKIGSDWKMTCEWNENSRYGAPRHFEFDGKDQITVTCKDVLYTSFNQGKDGKICSVDPDGGPYLYIGGTIYYMNRKFRILDIASHTNNARSLIAVFRVEEST